MKQKFKITGYQVVYEDNERDNVSLLQPVFIEDLKAYRNTLRSHYQGCKFVNLTYTEINTEQED